MITSFNSVGDYFRFGNAKSFFHSGEQKFFEYPKNLLERIGDRLVKPVASTTDFLLVNIRNPLMILALTVAAIALVTIAFYPTVFMNALGAVIPFVFSIEPWMVKLAVFAAVEINILGVGLRTLGRLTNKVLMQAWTNKEIIPISLGTQIIKTAP